MELRCLELQRVVPHIKLHWSSLEDTRWQNMRTVGDHNLLHVQRKTYALGQKL